MIRDFDFDGTGFTDNGKRIGITDVLHKINQLEARNKELKSTIYKLKCECRECGHVWTEQLQPEVNSNG